MDIVKLFTDDRLGLESLSDDADSDARRRRRGLPDDGPSDAADGLAAFLTETRSAPQYARVYLAGSVVGDAAPDGTRPALRTGLTALGDAESFVQPLLAWAGEQPWHALRGEALVGLTRPEAAGELRRGDATLAVGALADASLGRDLARLSQDRRATLAPLRRALDAGLAVLLPEPAPDGRDWSLYARAPLGDAVAQAFRGAPPNRGPGRAPAARCFAAPYQKMRGEHKFYFERWALDAPPAAVVEL